MTFSERLQEIRTGFERRFWVANISEMFERLSYYVAFASLALYLRTDLRLPQRPRRNSAKNAKRIEHYPHGSHFELF